ncbi:centromere protein P-like [Sinocyclocheilus grahami]|uniref:centromere protein P-like n=1 Tax=Sinocyclocheilus grahami TaxID=75366 RepID=UPI0007AC68B4|nr:PREDICTED: centromere protein P-like [Sinocyclocheilus grahami]
MLKEDDALLRRVTELNIVVDGVEFKDFSAFVSRVEDTKDLLLFFRTLRTFSERCEERRQTFQHFQEKYPDVVSLPEGCRSELMIIRSPQLPGISMTIFWKIDVSMEGVVKPSLELLLKMADQAREFDGLFSEPPAGSWGGSIYRGLDKNCVCEKSKIKPKFTLWELHI